MKTTATQLDSAIDNHSAAIDNFIGYATIDPAGSAARLRSTGDRLMTLLAQDMRATVDPEMVRMAESMVDRSAKMLDGSGRRSNPHADALETARVWKNSI